MDSESDLSYSDQEERRRVFWSIYLLDRIVSCGRARPPAILEASCQLQLPCDEQIWRAREWQKTEMLDQLSNKALLETKSQAPFALVVMMAYSLSRTAQYMLQDYNIRSRDPPWDANSDYASITSDLLYIESQLEVGRPIMDVIRDDFTEDGTIDQSRAGPVIFSVALFYLCHCLLNHPFLLRHRLEISNTKAPRRFLSRSFELGRSYAQRLTFILRDARLAGCTVSASFYGYCAVIAGTIQTLYMYSQNEIHQQDALECVQQNLTTLEEIARYWRNVRSMVRIILNLGFFDVLAMKTQVSLFN
jgi:hypothetical protein